jgi:hypothetical protein
MDILRGLMAGLLVLVGMCFPVHAVSLKDWQQAAIGVIIKFEGSDYEKVTPDFDCQGLTIGKGQWAIERGSAKTLFDEVARRTGESQFVAHLAALEGQFGDGPQSALTLTAAIAASRAGNKAEALRIVRAWQQQKDGDRWGLLAETDCSTANKRTSDVRLMPDLAPIKRLKAFLRDPEVVAAQEALLSNTADLALERAACWAKITRNEWRPHFYEFLFFYDYLTQNGARWIDDSELFDIVNRFDLEEGKPANEDRYMLAKMQQVRDWLQADFPYIRTAVPPSFLAHAQYATQNAKIWYGFYEAGKLEKQQVKLMYVGLLRAMLGNNIFGYVAMNRRGTIVTGQGVVNNTPHDLTLLYKQTGAIDQAEITKVLASLRSKVSKQLAKRSARVDACRP